MIDLVYKTLLTIINKENQGYVSPTEFNLLANTVQSEIFRGYFDDINKDKNKEHRGLTSKGHGNLVYNEEQRISQFSVPLTPIAVVAGICTLPEDLYIIEEDGIITGSTQLQPNVVVEWVSKDKINWLNKSLAKPTDLYPIYGIYNGSIRIVPTSITEVQITYLKKPSMPNWTYFMLPNGQPAYNPADVSFQDFELHESEFFNIVIKMLVYFGINLREKDVVQVAEVLKDKLNLKENS